MLALEMTTNGFPYIYWHDFIVQNKNQAPATVVSKYLKEKKADEHLAIWAFGYAMDSNSPIGWYESRTPLYFIEDAIQRQALEAEIERYVRSSNKIADSANGYLSLSIRMAWFGYDYEKEQEKKKNRKPDPFYNKAQKSFRSQPVEISKCFWSDTEEKFYESIKILYENAHHLTDTKKIELRSEWYRHIKKSAKKIFDRWAFKSKIQTNPHRISMAHNQLIENLNGDELKKNILGLPKEVN
jgi:effector-binding domain-containing protein